jgi:hypothetical protein
MYILSGMYNEAASQYFLSDGRRELTSANYLLMAPTSYTPCANCPCIYLDTNYQIRQAPCADIKKFLCEFKGKIILVFSFRLYCVVNFF